MQVQRDDDVIVSGGFDAALLGDDERRRAVGNDAQGPPSCQELHALESVGSHDDEVGVLLNSDVIDVFEN